ncbi:MAG TPA: hypothetical protein VES73_07945 [Lamprocystis sp. (in: g-proteobacteria)]|nr:hypothetical protein [Lamprocystis sp. (in: g-proteobacteria)]
MLRLLCRGHAEHGRVALVGWQFDDQQELARQINLLLGYMNGLCDQLDLPETMNQRVSQEIGHLIESSLE